MTTVGGGMSVMVMRIRIRGRVRVGGDMDWVHNAISTTRRRRIVVIRVGVKEVFKLIFCRLFLRQTL